MDRPLAARGQFSQARFGPHLQWTVQAGYDVDISVLWEYAFANVQSMFSFWAPNYLNGLVPQQFCHQA